jgi:urocanate hydratase
MGLFLKGSTTVVVTNGMVILITRNLMIEKWTPLCISIWTNDGRKLYVYRPTGIVHGTTITVLNGFQNKKNHLKAACNLWFRWNEWRTTQKVPIAGCITVCADVNQDYKYVTIRAGLTNYWGSWQISKQSRFSETNNEVVSIGYLGNVVDIWEKFDQEKNHID